MVATKDQYILKVTAGPDYTSQTPVSPNTEQPFTISSPKLDAQVTVRVQNYRGLPEHSPSTSPYFSHASHTRDLYSLQFAFIPKEDINAHDVVLGNDFDHPIRDRLPPGFDHALKIVKWFIDPGLEGDVYADEPGLFGPLLSSINTFRVCGKDESLSSTPQTKGGSSESKKDSAKGDKTDEDDDEEEVPYVVQEGASSTGEKSRSSSGIPADAAARKKFFLTPAHLKDYTFEKGRKYEFDFFNPYLDFNEFAVKLPGFSILPGITIPVISYWDGQPLRYVLRNRKTNEPLFVVIFTLVPKESAEAETSTTGDAQKKTAPEKTTTATTTADDDVD